MKPGENKDGQSESGPPSEPLLRRLAALRKSRAPFLICVNQRNLWVRHPTWTSSLW